MKQIAVVRDIRFQAHDPGAHHPERPERLQVLENLFDSAEFSGMSRVDARPVDEEEVRRVHTAALLESVEASRGVPVTQFDADTSASAGSFDAACLAAGGAIELADFVFDRSADCGFAALRPPGHHAERDRAMGFCFFNNVAIVARHLRERRGLERIAILDWDVHHGNGTQHTFYDDPSVLYVSLHQYPFYPGTGAAGEVGQGAGEGFTVNVPMSAGAGPGDYHAAFREIVEPVVRGFDPQFILISAGYDAHRDDPLASIMLDDAAYAYMTQSMQRLAREHCDGRLMFLLEGGYDLDALRSSVTATLRTAAGLPAADAFDLDEGAGDLPSGARGAREVLSRYWDLGGPRK